MSAQLDSGFHLACKADLRPAAGSYGILDEGDGVGEDPLEGCVRTGAHLEAGSNVFAPFDAAQDRRRELGVARVARQQVGRIHQCLEHVVEVMHQTRQRQFFRGLNVWAICRSVAKTSEKDTPADSAPSMAQGPSA